MSKILITAAHTINAIKLSKAFVNQEVVLADYGLASVLTIADFQLKSLGKYRRNALAHHLLSVCLDFEIDTLLPVYFEEIEAVSKSILLFKEYGINVLVPTPDLLDKLPKIENTDELFLAQEGEIFFCNLDNISLTSSNAYNGAFAIDKTTNEIGVFGVHYYQKPD